MTLKIEPPTAVFNLDRSVHTPASLGRPYGTAEHTSLKALRNSDLQSSKQIDIGSQPTTLIMVLQNNATSLAPDLNKGTSVATKALRNRSNHLQPDQHFSRWL